MNDIYPKIVVSFTSFPSRINKVWLVVECMLRQTYKNIKIVLWLSKEQFERIDVLPKNLLNLRKYGLDIRLVDGDISSHKKYAYAFQEYRDELVFLIDDDIIYPSTCVEEAYLRYIKAGYQKVVIGRWGKNITFDRNGDALPYSEWKTNNTDFETDFFFGSGGGTLLRPSDLYKDCCNKELFWKLTPTADDIWLNAQCRLNGVKIKLYKTDLLRIINGEDVQLTDINNGEKRNDKQMAAVIDYYKNDIGINPFNKSYGASR